MTVLLYQEYLGSDCLYMPSAFICCYDQQRVITPLGHEMPVAESLIKDSLLAVIQQRLSGMGNTLESHRL
jgi:hypothetical protein